MTGRMREGQRGGEYTEDERKYRGGEKILRRRERQSGREKTLVGQTD